MWSSPMLAQCSQAFTSSSSIGSCVSCNHNKEFVWFQHVFFHVRLLSWTSPRTQVKKERQKLKKKKEKKFEISHFKSFSLNLIIGLSYSPTSMVFVNVPSISKLQWHPFSVTSSSKLDADKLSVVIKSEGNWSQNLYQKLSSTQPIDRLQVSVEGPYGPVSNNMLRCLHCKPQLPSFS